jgi:hypothetical protein
MGKRNDKKKGHPNRHYNFISLSDVEKDISPEKLIKNENSLLMMFFLLVH